MQLVLNAFRIIRNTLDYPIRKLIKWKRPLPPIQNEHKENLFEYLSLTEQNEAENTAKRLLTNNHLNKFFNTSSRENYRETLFYIQMLEQAFKGSRVTLPQTITAADIGPGHWFYVQGLLKILTWWNASKHRQVEIYGFEADPYRVYVDLHSRYDHAKAHIRNKETLFFIPGPFKQIRNKYDVITMFFPFVFLNDHLQWGLPIKDFDPLKLLLQAWESLKPNGVLVIINQGGNEHQQQKKFLSQANINIAHAFSFTSNLYEYDIERFGLVGKKE